MLKKSKTIYIVQAWDIKENKLAQFNPLLTKTYDEALKFAKHLNNDVKEYYKDIMVITETYELKKRIVEEVKD